MSLIQHDPLQGLSFITTDVRIWSGTVKLSRTDDLSEVSDRLPPTKMVTDGRKMLVDQSALAPFLAIRKRLERLLAREGFRLRGSDAYAVKDSELTSIIEQILEMETDFNGLVPEFINELSNHYDQQAAQFPEWADQLFKGRLSASSVAARLNFSIGVYKISNPDPTNTNPALKQQYSNVVNSAVPSLLSDIAGKAVDLLKGPIGKKLVCTQAHHAQVRKLVERLSAFSFLDSRVGPTVTGLMDMLDGISLNGPLTVGNTAVLRVVVEQLSAPESVLVQLDAEPEPQATDCMPAVPAARRATPPTLAYVGL